MSIINISVPHYILVFIYQFLKPHRGCFRCKEHFISVISMIIHFCLFLQLRNYLGVRMDTLPIFKGSLKAYKRQKLCNFHIKNLPFAFRGICLLRERHLYLLKAIFFKIYRILPLGGKNVSVN